MSPVGKLLVLGAIAAALAAPAGATAGSAKGGDAAKVRRLLLHQADLFNQRRWKALWSTLTPRAQASCGYRKWVDLQRWARVSYGRVSVRKIAVRVRANRATVTYQLLAQGTVIMAATVRRPDIYARISGRWYDEFDSITAC